MNFYAQRVSQYDYYTVIKRSAERAKPGCSVAVRDALSLITAADRSTLIQQLNLCVPLPSYMTHDVATLRDEVLMVFSYSFAGLNMANYPPGPGASTETTLARNIAARDETRVTERVTAVARAVIRLT